jgi:hypothetical protein
MIKTSFLAALIVAVTAGAASAGGQAGSIGIGAEYQLSGLGGASLNYDAGQFHIGGFFGLYDPSGGNNTVLEIGGRFYYHVHSTAMSDFGIGGGFGLASEPQGGMNNNQNTNVYLEPGFQIRLFVASNVALSFTGGLTIGLIDAGGASLQGQGTGSSPGFDPLGVGFSGGAGVHYYFF